MRSLGTLRREFAPGERFKYSNMAFEILGNLIAKVSGETFDDYVQRHILVPLGMKDSTLPAAEFGGKASPTGISWFLGQYRGQKLVEHGGGDTGFRTHLAMLPDKKIAVVWMTNGEWLRDGAALTHSALDVALGLRLTP